LRPALRGIVLGVAGALLTVPFLESLLYEVEPRDPLALAVIAVVLVAVALAASYVPARRASRVDPFEAFRSE
jgi:putative ABC transport system permease protein